MPRSGETADDPAKAMLHDERVVIVERAAELSELNDDEFATVDEVAAELEFERDE